MFSLVNWFALMFPIKAIVTSKSKHFAFSPVFVYDIELPLPDHGSPCESQIVVNQVFANSYGHPSLIEYSTPANRPDFTHITA